MTDAERDELESIIRQGRWMHENPDDIADSIIAAGYRKVPDDCVVVQRDDVDTIIQPLTDYGAQAVDQWDEVVRIRQALTDQTT